MSLPLLPVRGLNWTRKIGVPNDLGMVDGFSPLLYSVQPKMKRFPLENQNKKNENRVVKDICLKIDGGKISIV
jgi:hypothetical protein